MLTRLLLLPERRTATPPGVGSPSRTVVFLAFLLPRRRRVRPRHHIRPGGETHELEASLMPVERLRLRVVSPQVPRPPAPTAFGTEKRLPPRGSGFPPEQSFSWRFFCLAAAVSVRVITSGRDGKLTSLRLP